MTERSRRYYLLMTAGLSATASLAGAFGALADGGDVMVILASALSAGLITVVVVGTISFWAAEVWRIEQLRRTPPENAIKRFYD